jgi:hypothetical protein
MNDDGCQMKNDRVQMNDDGCHTTNDR